MESERLRLDLDWPQIQTERQLVVPDEAQVWPEVFPRLRAAIDNDRQRNGRFLLLGSVSPALMTQVSESLAGRLALVELTPLLWPELPSGVEQARRWLCGGFADGGVLAAGAYPQWQLDYLALLVQRDLPNWGLPSRPQVTERLLRMLAASSGQTWNASKIGQSLGLTYHTVNRYTDYLAGAFLIRLLPPFEANVRKRITKRPKLHWRDSGLLHAVLQVVDHRTLLSQPWVGASWEGFVVDQTLGLLGALGQPHAGYHFRAGNQDEIDLVLEIDGEVWAIETKLTTSPSPRDLARLDRSAELIGASRRFLISQTPVPGGDDHRASHNLGSFSRWLVERFGGQRQGA